MEQLLKLALWSVDIGKGAMFIKLWVIVDSSVGQSDHNSCMDSSLSFIYLDSRQPFMNNFLNSR
jgi:hypothetical protein